MSSETVRNTSRFTPYDSTTSSHEHRWKPHRQAFYQPVPLQANECADPRGALRNQVRNANFQGAKTKVEVK